MPDAYGHQEVWIRGYVHEVVIGCGAGSLPDSPARTTGKIWSAIRSTTCLCWSTIEPVPWIRPRRYLDRNCLMPWPTLHRSHCRRRIGHGRQAGRSSRSFGLWQTFDLELVHGAVKDALRLGAIGDDAVKHLVLCRIERRPPKLDLDIYPYPPRANVATTAAASYMSLLGGGAS